MPAEAAGLVAQSPKISVLGQLNWLNWSGLAGGAPWLADVQHW